MQLARIDINPTIDNVDRKNMSGKWIWVANVVSKQRSRRWLVTVISVRFAKKEDSLYVLAAIYADHHKLKLFPHHTSIPQ